MPNSKKIYLNLLHPILVACVSFYACSKPKTPPNIIFIMADDHAAHAISAYGSKINKTPNIDRLAAEGMRLDNVFCTNAICAPSRAVILTGKYSHINGVIDNRARFDSSQQTLPKLLQQEGYQTAMIGKWHLKSQPTGFDYWNVLPGQGQYYNPDFIEMGERKRYHGYATDIITDICLEWLGKRDPQKPFFLFYHHKAPHRNWMPGPDHLMMYEDADVPVPETFFDDYATRSDAARQQEMTVARHMFLDFDLKVPAENLVDQYLRKAWKAAYSRMDSTQRAKWDEAYGPRNDAFLKAKLEGKERVLWNYQRYIKDYLRTIASIDDNLGRLLQYLDENGLTENTVVVYTSDQGFFLGDHGWFDKRFMYEEALRMPFIIRYPRLIRPGSTSDALILNLDFAETFLDLAGVSIADDMQGRSFVPVLQGRLPQDWRTAMYYHYYEYPAWHMVKKHYGIRTDRYKLIHFYDDIDAWEMYDLQADPHELNNVYNDPAYSEIRENLREQLKRLQKQYRVEAP